MNIKGIQKEHYKQFFAHKFYNLNEMDQLLGRHNLPKDTPEEIDNLNRPITKRLIQ
jgi:hypothetical protein